MKAHNDRNPHLEEAPDLREEDGGGMLDKEKVKIPIGLREVADTKV